jgi:hypothetical protein
LMKMNISNNSISYRCYCLYTYYKVCLNIVIWAFSLQLFTYILIDVRVDKNIPSLSQQSFTLPVSKLGSAIFWCWSRFSRWYRKTVLKIFASWYLYMMNIHFVCNVSWWSQVKTVMKIHPDEYLARNSSFFKWSIFYWECG